MTRTLLIFAALALGVATVFAQSDVNAARKEFMKDYRKFGDNTVSRMARDQMPYDQAKVDEAMAHFAETAAKIPSLFPAGGFQGPVADSNYFAAAKAFENQSDIQARTEKFAKDIADAKGKIRDLASLKEIWLPLYDKNCSSCHEAYRLRRPS